MAACSSNRWGRQATHMGLLPAILGCADAIGNVNAALQSCILQAPAAPMQQL